MSSFLIVLLPLAINCESSCGAGFNTCDLKNWRDDSSTLLQKTLHVDDHTDTHTHTHARMQSGLLQVKEMKQSDKPLVLFTLVFGNGYMERPLMQLFMKSVANTAVDYVVIGDASPVAPLPKNMRHVNITWEQMVDRLQSHFPGVDLQSIREAPLRKVCDLKPFAPMLVQADLEDFHRYKYWGHVDNDMWIGDTSILAAKLMERTEDVFLIDLQSSHTLGPFQIYRNNAIMNGGIWKSRQNFEIAKDMLSTSEYMNFDEWGDYSPAAKGVDHSMTGVVRRGVDNAEITSASLALVYKDEEDMIFDIHDAECFFNKQTDDCGFCEMRTSETVSGQTLTRLFTMENKEIFMCHFQYSKKGSWYQETHFNDMQDLLEARVIHSTFANGVSLPVEAKTTP